MRTIYIITFPDGNAPKVYTTLTDLCKENSIKRCTAAKGLLKKDVHQLRNGKTVHRSTLNTSRRLGKKGGNRFK